MKRILFLALQLLLPLCVAGQTLFEEARVERLVEAFKAGEERAVGAVEALQEVAERELLVLDPLYVTQKEKLPPSGDKRDYMTLSPYWWPDPEKADGLPYIRRDGERNPEVYDYPERVNSGLLGEATTTLALLYRCTGEERYAEQAARLIRAWFLDAERGMHPNMRYAQLIPGRRTLRGTGIIDSRRFLASLSAATMIEGSKAWQKADRRALKRWVADFLCWLEKSEQGRKELLAPNNHGLWYDANRLMCLAYLERKGAIRRVVEESMLPRLECQIAADGTLPRELERTLSLHYSTFVLEAVMAATNLSGNLGELIWSYRTTDGRSLEQVVERLAPAYADPSLWPYQQIAPFAQDRGARILDRVGRLLNRPEWVDEARRIGCARSLVDQALYFQ